MGNKPLRCVGQVRAIGPGLVRKVKGLIAKDEGHGVRGGLERPVRDCSKALQGVRCRGTPCALHDGVVYGLAIGDVADWKRGSRVHDSCLEETARSAVLAAVDEHLVADRDGAGGLAPDGDA